MACNSIKLVSSEKLSETMLAENLKDKCTVDSNVETSPKAKSIDMSKRIAIPMPQRNYNEAKYLGKKLHNLRVVRKISVSTEEDEVLYKSLSSCQNKIDRKSNCSNINSSTALKKLQQPNISFNSNSISENASKRKINEDKIPVSSEYKKRQKITWP